MAYRSCILLCTLFLVAAGCNVFSPFHTSGTGENVSELIADVEAALTRGDYPEAMAIADKAMRLAPDRPRVRYIHAVSVLKYHGIDITEIIHVFEPPPADTSRQRILLMTEEELDNLFRAFSVSRQDLEPLVATMQREGRELPGVRETDDVLLGLAVSDIFLGLLRILDNDPSEAEFSLDTRVEIEKAGDGYWLSIDGIIDPCEQIDFISRAIGYGWGYLSRAREAMFLYYEFVENGELYTGVLAPCPEPYPAELDTGTAVGSLTDFIDDGISVLYDQMQRRCSLVVGKERGR